MKKILLILVSLSLSTSVFANDYDVSGYGDSGSAYGTIDTMSGSKYVDGYLELEDGSSVYFDGEFTGYGTVEGYDENGDFYELDVD